MAPLHKLAVVAFLIVQGAIAAPCRRTTHAVRSVGPRGTLFHSYHPEPRFETYGVHGVAHPLAKRGLPSTHEEAARAFLSEKMGCEADTLARKSGHYFGSTAHEYFRQSFNNIPVANAVANVALKGDRVVSFGTSFVKPKSVAAATPLLLEEEAVESAEAALGGVRTEHPVFVEYFAKDTNHVVLTYVVNIRNYETEEWHEAFVDAHTGEIVNVISFGSHASYRAIPLTSADPTNGFQTFTDPHDPISSPDGWHAYRSIFSGELHQSPADNKDAATVNAFYVVNMMHDLLYRYGFTESAYNFQYHNNGKGGAQNDNVYVSVQVSEKTVFNDASFFTPGDGVNGELRLYLWNKTTPFRDVAFEKRSSNEARALGEGWSDAVANWLCQWQKLARLPLFDQYEYQPLTYSSLQTRTEYHAAGELWGNIWHEIFAAFVSKYGFSNDKNNSTGTAGNIVALQLLIDALPLQPCNPTFVNARDAILQADFNRSEGANACLLWSVFAKRGLGYDQTPPCNWDLYSLPNRMPSQIFRRALDLHSPPTVFERCIWERFNPVRNIMFGTVINRKADVEDRLRILYLGRVVQQSLFRRISSRLKSQDQMSLIYHSDLPGIIANVREGSDESDIELVKRLVTSYIRKESCIILLTGHAKVSDFENQGARSLAKQHDPDGKRTIGVLTKPDRIESGEEQKWLAFVRGETEVLSKGWFCVKQPSPSELEERLSWSEARQREQDFFGTKHPWATQSLAARQHFGTARLTTRLSEILSDLIQTRMPSLIQEIQRLTQSTVEGLRLLPNEVSEDPAGAVLNLVMDFHRDVSTHVEGIPDSDGLIQQVREASTKFRNSIRASAPCFRPYKTKYDKDSKYAMPKVDFIIEEDGDFVTQEDVGTMSQNAITRELPKNIPFIVKQKLIKRFVELWEGPTTVLWRIQHSYGGLHNAVGTLVADRILQCREVADAQIRFLLDIENNQTFTTNTHYFASYKEKFITYYKAKQLPTSRRWAYRPTCRSGETHPARGEDELIDIMAEVRAYYQVAYKRFVDVIPMATDETLVRGFCRGLEKRLFEGLGVSGEGAKERCASLLEYSHEITLEREMLKTRRDRLLLARHNELVLSLKELSYGVKSSQILSGPIAGSKGAPPMATIVMPDDVGITVQVTENGWQVCDPTSHIAAPRRFETLDDLLTEHNEEYAKRRQDSLIQKLLAVVAERERSE
ncbi:extracellular metalloproteinase MEP [Rhizoctonia solani]|uniref:Extracellular metalloproteinase MEP n=1 Tax=Rhizoctonia solani TaxID=456999 RepID=A0A8H8T0L9_9AGAM|nr:extracellular metalloproteinase MEP [Rhizoctonia solani]QRW24504.1 extracellular metalloproteinase MEP [Rhizoctonia solani]